MIQKFISEICAILNIEVPSISYDTSNFPTDTMMACCDTENNIIYLKKYGKPNPDQLFSIAHELRHMWQIKSNKLLYFFTYKPIDLCESIEEYNLQIAEYDANAFGALVMLEIFSLKPLFEGLSDTVKTKIYERMEYIKDTELLQ